MHVTVAHLCGAIERLTKAPTIIVRQPTIGRRLAAFEATFGGPTLFDDLPLAVRQRG